MERRSALSTFDATGGPYSSPRHSFIRLLRRVPELEAGPDAVLKAEDVAAKLEWPVVRNGRAVSQVDITGSERQW